MVGTLTPISCGKESLSIPGIAAALQEIVGTEMLPSLQNISWRGLNHRDLSMDSLLPRESSPVTL